MTQSPQSLSRHHNNPEIREVLSQLEQEQLKCKSLDAINKSLTESLDKNEAHFEDTLARARDQYKREFNIIRKVYVEERDIFKLQARNLESQIQVLTDKIGILEN